MTYIWQHPLWPELSWDSTKVIDRLTRARLAQGLLLGRAAGLGFELGLDLRLEVLTQETLETAAIEGETIARASVRSSVARRLGLPQAGLPPTERHADGLVEVLFDATTNHAKSLTVARLHQWQAALFPTGFAGMQPIPVGAWRSAETPMRVVSGPIGRERVHFEAPPADRLDGEIDAFLRWWSHSTHTMDGLIRAALAHFRFVTIHPFADGNGRIARAIGEMALAQDENTGSRFYSLSAQINAERQAYYDVLERTQRGGPDVTGWLDWFLGCFERALERSTYEMQRVLAKARFWQDHAASTLNDRQRKAINRLLDAGPGGFTGGLTTRKYTNLTKTTRATAQRDISDLLSKGLIRRNPGRGRSTSYDLCWPEE